MGMEKHKFIVSADESGQRLDRFLSSKLSNITRSHIKNAVDDGLAFVDGEACKAGKTLKEGQEVVFEEHIKKSMEYVQPEDLPLTIVFEDEFMAVVSKPRGMTVHPSPGHKEGTLAAALLFHFGKLSDVNDGNVRPGIVHRIDKNTTGLLVVAKTNEAHVKLARQIEKKTCRRRYLALLEGVLKQDAGTVDQPIGRSPMDRKKMAVVEGGKRAVTHFKVLERFEKHTLVQFDLETGRTHQIRVHSKFLKHPVVGDPEYGFAKQKFSVRGQLLHAYELMLKHPVTGENLQFFAEMPDDFLKVLNILRNQMKNG